MANKMFYRGPSLAVLQRDYAKRHRVDNGAPLVSASMVDIAAPIGKVWNTLSDVSAWAHWAPRVEVLHLERVRRDARFIWRLNGIKVKATFAVVEPSHELSWTGTFFGYRAIDRNVLEPLDAGDTRVTFEESLAGLLLPLLYRSDQLRANHERWLSSLKAFVESGRGPGI